MATKKEKPAAPRRPRGEWQVNQPDQHPRALDRAGIARGAAAALEAPEALAAAAPQHECTPTKIRKTGSNGDEKDFPDKRGNFHKGLPHDAFGEVNAAAYKSLLVALRLRRDFDDIVLGGGRPLTNPQAGLAGDLEGPCPRQQKMLAAPKVDSAETAAEAVEDYWMALLRDVPFTDFAANADVAAAAKEISGLTDFTGPKIGGAVTPQTIFRGCSYGDTTGPYLSQFLLKPIGYGSLTIEQRQKTVAAGKDYLTAYDRWLAVQNGDPGPFADQFDPTARYIRNMRDLGQYVHVDALYEAYLNACLILLDAGAPVDPGNPYAQGRPDAKTQIGFGTFGGPHILSLLTEVATRALKAVWYQKWSVHRRLRPEECGGLVHLTLVGANGTKKNYGLHKQVLDSVAVQRTLAKNKTALLPMAFPEGSPTHPAYGAGHATVAGACVTILKAWFKEDEPLANPVVPNAAGTDLVPYTGPGAGDLTIEGELNKVGANIAIGRDMAGVHWRSDYTESIRLGEEVALCILLNQRFDYNECDWSFSLRRFDGTRVSVSPQGLRDERGRVLKFDCDACKGDPNCK
jgi:hypothetical protein